MFPSCENQTARSHQATVRDPTAPTARSRQAARPLWGTRQSQAVRLLNSGACSNHRGPPRVWVYNGTLL